MTPILGFVDPSPIPTYLAHSDAMPPMTLLTIGGLPVVHNTADHHWHGLETSQSYAASPVQEYFVTEERHQAYKLDNMPSWDAASLKQIELSLYSAGMELSNTLGLSEDEYLQQILQ